MWPCCAVRCGRASHPGARLNGLDFHELPPLLTTGMEVEVKIEEAPR